MNVCERDMTELAVHALGALDEEDRPTVEEHVAACQRCRTELDELSDVRDVLDMLPREAWLAPGFIDTQVNGGGDVLFNDDPTPHGIAAIAAAHRRFGTTALPDSRQSASTISTTSAVAIIWSAGKRSCTQVVMSVST